jgi:hypothetical protein
MKIKTANKEGIREIEAVELDIKHGKLRFFIHDSEEVDMWDPPISITEFTTGCRVTKGHSISACCKNLIKRIAQYNEGEFLTFGMEILKEHKIEYPVNKPEEAK